MYGISKISIIPGRAEPSDKAEGVTQLLFGEHYTILDEEKKWVKVKAAHDGYEFWIDRKQHTPISKADFVDLEEGDYPRTLDILGIAKDQGRDIYFNLPVGSVLPFFDDGEFRVTDSEFKFKGTLAHHDPHNLIPYALIYMDAPYLWGGRTPFGIDCSGFTQMAFKLIGIDLPRDAYQQAELGEQIELKDAREGDLAFFDNEEGRITHVGILYKANQILHASGKVRDDSLDGKGIYNEESKEYTHGLHSVRRIITL